MKISLVGINHQTAPVAIRERAAISTNKISDALVMLRSHISQGIILSTCNRTEIYTIDNDDQHARSAAGHAPDDSQHRVNGPGNDVPGSTRLRKRARWRCR